MTKVVITDIDEVVFNWQGPFEKWILREGKYTPTQPLCNFWDIERWLEIPYDEGRHLIEEFNHLEEFWPNFEPLSEVRKNILALEDLGYKFVAVTACSEDEWTHVNRWHNLKRCFGTAFDTLHCVGLSASKKEMLERYKPTYWVEDKLRHAIDGADLGHTSFIVDYPWNRYANDDRITRVKNWNDIFEIITSSEKANNR